MQPREYRNHIGGAWTSFPEKAKIQNPFTGSVVALYPVTPPDQLDAAILAAVQGFEEMRRMPVYQRSACLLALRDGLNTRREEFARTIAEEAGKPITDARVEVDRGVNVLTLSAEEAKRIEGEVMNLDLTPAAAGRLGLTRRFPVGPIAAITPYNFPLNLGLHKIGPALAAGCSVIWKPSLLAPGAAILFADLLEGSGLPAGAVNVVTPGDLDSAPLVQDPRLRMLSFTGSARVGWVLRSRAGAKRVTLELGGNAAVLIAADADLDHAARRCAAGGYEYAGQVCISVQRILIEQPVYQAFLDRFLPLVREIRVGDPLDERTQMGPMVSEKAASRVEQWISQAIEGGARLLTGGKREGLFFEPAVLEGVKPEMKLSCEEAFGPVVTVEPFDSWEEALSRVNASAYGLQAGLFVESMPRILQAWDTLEVGGIIVNDVPTFRMDSMPYGGVKQSGLGREGIRYAIEEMTEIRLLALSNAL